MLTTSHYTFIKRKGKYLISTLNVCIVPLCCTIEALSAMTSTALSSLQWAGSLSLPPCVHFAHPVAAPPPTSSHLPHIHWRVQLSLTLFWRCVLSDGRLRATRRRIDWTRAEHRDAYSWPRGHLVLNHHYRVLFGQKKRAELAYNLMLLRIIQKSFKTKKVHVLNCVHIAQKPNVCSQWNERKMMKDENAGRSYLGIQSSVCEHIWQGSSFMQVWTFKELEKRALSPQQSNVGEVALTSAPLVLNAAAVILPQRLQGCHWSDIT